MNADQHARPVRSAEFRFYEELNDYLPAERRKVSFNQSFHGTPSIKDTIQAIGVPHGAIDLILVNGLSVDFTCRLTGGERVAVYPVFERLDISPAIKLRAEPLRCTRFILDVHLGKLASYLRMLGFDSAYSQDRNDDEIIRLAREQGRIILTRDLGILKQKSVSHGHWIRHHQPLDQMKEVLDALDLYRKLRPFTRCMECNEVISAVSKDEIRDLAAPEIFDRFDEFWQCGGCRKIYWQGSHYKRMLERIKGINPS
jgi:uncharacterized protein with PIN domain